MSVVCVVLYLSRLENWSCWKLPNDFFFTFSLWKRNLSASEQKPLELLIWIVLVGILAQRIENSFKFFKTILTDASRKKYSSES